MKYFVRILVFLFISFSFGFCRDSIRPIKELLYYTNEITSFSDISSLGVDVNKNNISNVGTIFTTLSSFKYFFKSPLDGRLFYLIYRDFESKIDNIFYELDSTSITFYYLKNPAMKFEYKNWEFVSVTYVDSLEKSCESTLFGYGTFNGFFCVRKGYDVPCLNPDYYFSEKLGKCIPKQECPVGQYAKMDYNDNGEYIGQSCTSNCFELLNRRDRFDCTCNLFGKGNYVSSKIDSVLEISNGGPSGDFYSGEVQCENGSFTNKDISDYISDSRDDNSPISKDKLKSLASTFMGANDYPSTNYTSGSSDGDKGSKKPLSSEEQKQDKDKVEIDEPPAPQNPSESIKYDENTNTVTTTDSAGNTQAVTPSNVTKNDKGELQSIEYTDPETGKDIEYKTKDDGTWERVEHQGQGTNPNENDSGTGQGEGKPGGSSDGEGAGTSDNGKKDGEDDGDGKFVGGEFGALGNANDFDQGGKALSAFEDLDKKSTGLIDSAESLYQDSLSALTDFKSSVNSLKEKANELRDNPFSPSIVSSCPISFSLLDQTIDIDICKYTSQFRNLIYFLIYIPLNLFIAFKLLSLLFLIIVNI